MPGSPDAFEGWECLEGLRTCEAGRDTCPRCAWILEEDWFDPVADEAALAELRGLDPGGGWQAPTLLSANHPLGVSAVA